MLIASALAPLRLLSFFLTLSTEHSLLLARSLSRVVARTHKYICIYFTSLYSFFLSIFWTAPACNNPPQTKYLKQLINIEFVSTRHNNFFSIATQHTRNGSEHMNVVRAWHVFVWTVAMYCHVFMEACVCVCVRSYTALGYVVRASCRIPTVVVVREYVWRTCSCVRVRVRVCRTIH